MEQSALVGPKASKRNAALQPLGFLIGDWRTTGSHPMVSGKKLFGRTSFMWHEGGAFLIIRQQINEPRFPDGVAIIGSDNAAGTCSMIYFDERGVSRVMDVTFSDQAVTWRHDSPDFAQRVTISRDGDRLVSQGLMSNNGGPWEDDLSQVFKR